MGLHEKLHRVEANFVKYLHRLSFVSMTVNRLLDRSSFMRGHDGERLCDYAVVDADAPLAAVTKALALGIPCVKVDWLVECLRLHRLVDSAEHEKFAIQLE